MREGKGKAWRGRANPSKYKSCLRACPGPKFITGCALFSPSVWQSFPGHKWSFTTSCCSLCTMCDACLHQAMTHSDFVLGLSASGYILTYLLTYFTVVPHVVKSSASLATSTSTSRMTLAMTSSRHRDVIDPDAAEVFGDSARSGVTEMTFRPPASRVTNQVVYHASPSVNPLPVGNDRSVAFNTTCDIISKLCNLPTLILWPTNT